MNAAPDALKDREIVSLKHAAKTAGVDQRTLRKRMAEKEIPMIELGPRKRGMLLAHFDELIASLAKPAKPVGVWGVSQYDEAVYE